MLLPALTAESKKQAAAGGAPLASAQFLVQPRLSVSKLTREQFDAITALHRVHPATGTGGRGAGGGGGGGGAIGAAAAAAAEATQKDGDGGGVDDKAPAAKKAKR